MKQNRVCNVVQRKLFRKRFSLTSLKLALQSETEVVNRIMALSSTRRLTDVHTLFERFMAYQNTSMQVFLGFHVFIGFEYTNIIFK